MQNKVIRALMPCLCVCACACMAQAQERQLIKVGKQAVAGFVETSVPAGLESVINNATNTALRNTVEAATVARTVSNISQSISPTSSVLTPNTLAPVVPAVRPLKAERSMNAPKHVVIAAPVIIVPNGIKLSDGTVWNGREALNSAQLADLMAQDTNYILFGSPATYAKFARIQAVEAQGGEVIETILADGTRETTNVAEVGDWIATNPGGEQYIIKPATFAKKYEPATELGGNWYKPKGGPQQFVQIKRDMSVLASWGEVQNIKAGGYLNVTNPTDIYGIGEEEFNNTYKLVE